MKMSFIEKWHIKCLAPIYWCVCEKAGNGYVVGAVPPRFPLDARNRGGTAPTPWRMKNLRALGRGFLRHARRQRVHDRTALSMRITRPGRDLTQRAMAAVAHAARGIDFAHLDAGGFDGLECARWVHRWIIAVMDATQSSLPFKGRVGVGMGFGSLR